MNKKSVAKAEIYREKVAAVLADDSRPAWAKAALRAAVKDEPKAAAAQLMELARLLLQPVAAEPKRKITPQQLRILELFEQGQPMKTVAAVLGVEASTVKVHTWRMYRRLGVHNKQQAINAGRSAGLLKGDNPCQATTKSDG